MCGFTEPAPGAMLAPDPAERYTSLCPPEQPMAERSGASNAKWGPTLARAPLRWPYTSHRAMEAAQRRAAQNDETSDSGMASDDDSSHSSAGREHSEQDDADHSVNHRTRRAPLSSLATRLNMASHRQNPRSLPQLKSSVRELQSCKYVPGGRIRGRGLRTTSAIPRLAPEPTNDQQHTWTP